MNENDKQADQGKDILSTPHPRHFGIPIEHWEAANNYAEYMVQNKQAEPVAWMDEFGNVFPLGAQRGPKHLNEPMKPLYTHPAQPVQSAVARGEPVAYLHHISNNDDSESYVVDFARTHPLSVDGGDFPLVHPTPTAAINEQLLEALKKAEDAMTWEIGGEPCGLEDALYNARAAIAEAEKARGCV